MSKNSIISLFRRQLKILDNCVFLNYAGSSTILKSVREAMCRFLKRRMEYPSLLDETWKIQEDSRREVATSLLNADVEEVAFTPNVSFSITSIALALRSLGFRKVTCIAYDFPSTIIPWKASGWKISYSKTHRTEDVIEAFKKSESEVVCVSHVNYLTGEKLDIDVLSEEIHKRKGYLLVDCYQSMGPVKLNVKRCNVDFLTFGFGKWLLGPVIAALYVRGDIIESLKPPNISWLSLKEPFKFDVENIELDPTARRFEVASLDLVLKVGAAASATMFKIVDQEFSKSRVLELTGILIEELKNLGYNVVTPEDPRERLGIVSFKTRDPEKTVKVLEDKKIIVSPRKNCVRVSVHFFNWEEELENLVSALKRPC